MQKNLQNAEEGHMLSKFIPTEKKSLSDNTVKVGNDHPQPIVQTDLKVYFSLF